MAAKLHDDDTLLTRDMAATALTEAGYPVKSKTLATKATRGGGPPYRLFGVRPLYRWGDALEWAQARLSAPRRSTSQKDAEAAIGLPAVTQQRSNATHSIAE
jgi:hypothetical protein